jgi:hypothetical protein
MKNWKTKICLNAMVGNEEKTILRMLDSVYNYIDYWVIQCNGNDKTQEIIENFFKEKQIPGFTYQVEWKFPGWNRNDTLQMCLKSEHNCDWILRMDADERLEVDLDFDWSILEDTSVQSYNITAQSGELKYFRTWFWNAKLPWFFQLDKRHETIHLPDIGENFQRENMPYGFRHLVSQDGNTWSEPRKFLKDALELEIDKVVGNTVLDDPYHLWYIGKSYADCYANSNELPFGRKHSEEYARRAIWYYERFIEHTNCLDNNKIALKQDEMVYFGFIVMGQCWEFIGDSKMAIESYETAHQFSPRRNESHLYLAFYFESIKKYEECLSEINFMLKNERINPFPEFSFLIEGKAYYDTSNFLIDYKNRIEKKLTEPTIGSESFKFVF